MEAAALRRLRQQHLDDGIRGDQQEQPRQRWTLALVVYLRLLAILCLGRGLLAWGDVLGIGRPELFEAAPFAVQSTTVFFAVLNCVAAVGVWMTSAWGAVVWLTIAIVELVLPLVLPALFGNWTTMSAVWLGTIAVYFVLTWLSTHERRDIQ
jgi:hypothetical protein